MAFLKNTVISQLDDHQLLQEYKRSGSLEALGTLYSRYMDMCYAVCLKYLENRESAQDAVLQVFEELVAKLRRHDPQHFKGWLYTVVKNHCLMQLRKSGRNRTVSFEQADMQFEEEWHPDSIKEKEEQLKRMSDCIETLSAEQKRSVELFYLKDKCYKEIEQLTGWDFNKVRSMIQNGKRNLKICMEKKITAGADNAGTGIKKERK